MMAGDPQENEPQAQRSVRPGGAVSEGKRL